MKSVSQNQWDNRHYRKREKKQKREKIQGEAETKMKNKIIFRTRKIPFKINHRYISLVSYSNGKSDRLFFLNPKNGFIPRRKSVEKFIPKRRCR